MTWLAQVLHVARKDVSMARWLIIAYVALVGAATVSYVTARDFGLAALGWTFFIMLLGMLLLAVLVQTDSPARSDAFWVTRPLRPTAVFAAKLLQAFVAVVGVALIGQIIGLQVHDVASEDYAPMLAISALMYMVWLALAAAIASLTRDLRTFVIAFIVLVVGSVAWTLLIEMQVWSTDEEMVAVSVSGAPSMLMILLSVVAMFSLVAHQYVTRDVKRGIVIAIAIVLASYAARPLTEKTIAPLPSIPAEHRADPVAAEIALVPIPGLDLVQARISMRVQGGSESYRYALLISSRPVLQRRDGSADTVDVVGNTFVMRVGTERKADYRWMNAGADTLDAVIVNLSPDQAEELRRGDAHLRIAAGVDVRAMTELGTLPLRGRPAIAVDGRRVRVLGATFAADTPKVDVALSRIYASSQQRRIESLADPMTREFEFALVNEERREALPLTQRWTSSGGFDLLLPGPSAWSSTSRLYIRPAGHALATPPDEEWFRASQLHVVHWASIGNYPVEITARVSDTSPVVDAKDSCSRPALTEDRTICPAQRVGPLQSNTTRAQLGSLFPAELIRDRPIDVGEGTFQAGTVVNVGQPDSAQVVWSDSSRTRISMVLALGPAWRTQEGLGMGSSLQEIERALGAVSILGFGWDYGGTVTLAGTRLENAGVFFRTQPSITDYRGTDAYNRVRGDRTFASSDPDVRALAPVVTRVDVIWNL